MVSYPDYLPASCPPAEASPTDLTLYRFTKSNPPTERDFRCKRLQYSAEKRRKYNG